MDTKYSIPGRKSKDLYAVPAASKYISGLPEDETLLNVVFVRGEGDTIVDADGNRYLDFANCLNLPFGHEPIGSSGRHKVINSSNYLTPERLDLIELISGLFPSFAGFQFRSSGAESVEAALRYARSCEESMSVISIAGCYHGLTLAAQEIMGHAGDSPAVSILEFPETLDQQEAAVSKITQELDRTPVILALESVQGATLRILPECFLDAISVLKGRYPDRLYIFLDDMLASIRCGSWMSAANLNPDLFVAGKSWAGGFPFSFFAISEHVRRRGGDILGTTTYGGNPVACAAASGTIRRVGDERIFEHIARATMLVMEELPRWIDLSIVRRTNCLGLLFGVELENLELARLAGMALLVHGILCARIDRVLRFAPPLNIDLMRLRKALSTITSVLRAYEPHD